MDSYPVNLLDAFIDQIDLGIIVLDDQLRIRHWNSFISQRSGKNLPQAQGRDFVEVFPEANASTSSRWSNITDCP